MDKPLLYDVYSGAGGATRGYQMAGFRVVGIDIKPQARYCGDGFIQMDAFAFFAAAQRGDFPQPAAWHCSPPCQAYSRAAMAQRNSGKHYPDLVAATRAALEKTGVPWVIENVPNAPIRADFRLCGCHFGLDLRRERWFETSWHAFSLMPPCYHPYPVVSVVGHGTPTWVREKLGFNPTIHHYRAAMGIDWMTRDELSQAIPPKFTHHIGLQLLRHIRGLQAEAA